MGGRSESRQTTETRQEDNRVNNTVDARDQSDHSVRYEVDERDQSDRSVRTENINNSDNSIRTENTTDSRDQSDRSVRTENIDNSDRSVRNETITDSRDQSDRSVRSDLGDGAIHAGGNVTVTDGGIIDKALSFLEGATDKVISSNDRALNTAFKGSEAGVTNTIENLGKWGLAAYVGLLILKKWTN